MAASAKSKRTTKAPSKAQSKPAAKPRRTIRLASDIQPQEIALAFKIDPTAKAFSGSARYALRLDRRKRQIELHAADLRVSGVRAFLPSGEPLGKGRVEFHPECETILLHFDNFLPAGGLVIELNFRGRVRKDLRGLYASSDREAPWVATQLCPTDARRVFPCFDEPGTKARYTIEITAPSDQTVISNAPVESSHKVGDGLTRTCFAETPLLSAYLIAFVVGPFEASKVIRSGTKYSKKPEGTPTEIRIYTLPDRKDLARFARKTAAASLTRLEEWFGMAHPYPKLDLVALPDFAFGAMENAGAVFFRDSILLLDEAEASPADRKRAGETIAHELAHMWFGNLVTMAWWNDLWLNESFATWMAYVIIEDWQPEWRIWLDFGHRREEALKLDALASSHPIAPPIRTAEEAHENFDAITYTKGATVMRMLERYLGAETFREGIRLYIERHQEGAATASDLWSALKAVSGEDVEAIVSPWMLQTGFPLVRVAHARREDGPAIELQQERFLAAAAQTSPSARSRKRGAGRNASTWPIPWVGRVGLPEQESAESGPLMRPVLRHLLAGESDSVRNPHRIHAFVYGNAADAGFFRVEHGESEYSALLENLDGLSELERIGLVGHQIALTQSGRSPLADLLDLIAGLRAEKDPDVLRAVEAALSAVFRRVAPSRGAAVESGLRGWVDAHFRNALEDIGPRAKRGENERDRMRRARLFSIVGGMAQVRSVLSFCQTQTTQHLEHAKKLPPDLAAVILQLGASRGDAALHAHLCEATRDATTPQARLRTLLALAACPGPAETRTSLRACLDESLAPIPDRAALLMALLGNPGSAETTWTFMQKSWRKLERQMPPILLARVAAVTADALPTEQSDEILAFFRDHPLAAGDRVLRQIEEELRIAQRFEAHAGPDLDRYVLMH
ncbi:MAG: M1 family aminopeptidase [Myxococcota bacterium]